ncbi:MAG: HAMP domain-containing sensor histidine kinase, partial [Asticcacaulis sp.]
YVESARMGIEDLLTLITTTVDEDEARSGQMSVDRQPLDLDQLAQELADGFATMAMAKGLHLSVTLPVWPERGAAMGDPLRAEQILSHLLANAIQYTLKGKVEIRILPPEQNSVRIEVVDSGPGLDASELTRAFLPHERIARTSAGHSGAGLGLNLSQRLAGLMGGQLGAQSTPDVGSKFWLDLPFDPDARRPMPEAPVAIVEDAPVTGLKVMLVSGDSLRSAQLRDTLEALGHRCLTTTTRQRALSLASKGDIDAVLLTGDMEDLSQTGNREAIEDWLGRLRATQSQARLNILALLADGDQAEDLSEIGITPLLAPPSEGALRRALAGN